jgi:dolichol-phosphate mannosyltransferase
MMKVSIISPVYKAANILPTLVKRISEVCDSHKLDYEIILVNDCSPDNSWEVIQTLAKQYSALKGLSLSKNFGQHYAITAGISRACGDSIIIMDCDLQDNPEYIISMLHKQQEGFNVVCTIKEQKKYSWYRRFTSDLYFFLVNKLSDIKLEKNLGTMTLIDRKVADEYLKIGDYHRHSSMVFAWLGFNRGFVSMKHEKRFEGKSSYSMRKLISHAINGVISQSDKLLRWSISVGLFLFLASIAGVIYILIKSLFYQFEVGWPSLVVLILFTTGIILFMVGILGIYIGKIFEQVKNRPLFIIAEETGN